MARSTRRNRQAVESEGESAVESPPATAASKKQATRSRRAVQEEEEEEEEEEEAPGDEDIEDGYTPEKMMEHLFMQTMLSRRIVTQKLGQSILDSCAKICKVAPGPNRENVKFEPMRARLDKTLSTIEMSFTGKVDEVTGAHVFAITNMVSDETSKLATEYKPEELAFFRVVVEKIMHARNMAYAVSHGDAMASHSDKRVNLSNRTKQANFDLIRSFVLKGWLDVDEQTNALYLSQRSIRELGRYLRETFKEDDDDEETEINHSTVYVDCFQCKQFVSHGWACPNDECSVRLHKHCAQTRLMGARSNCPKCETEWTTTSTGKKQGVPVGLSNGAKLVSGTTRAFGGNTGNVDSSQSEAEEDSQEYQLEESL